MMRGKMGRGMADSRATRVQDPNIAGWGSMGDTKCCPVLVFRFPQDWVMGVVHIRDDRLECELRGSVMEPFL